MVPVQLSVTPERVLLGDLALHTVGEEMNFYPVMLQDNVGDDDSVLSGQFILNFRLERGDTDKEVVLFKDFLQHSQLVAITQDTSIEVAGDAVAAEKIGAGYPDTGICEYLREGDMGNTAVRDVDDLTTRSVHGQHLKGWQSHREDVLRDMAQAEGDGTIECLASGWVDKFRMDHYGHMFIFTVMMVGEVTQGNIEKFIKEGQIITDSDDKATRGHYHGEGETGKHAPSVEAEHSQVSFLTGCTGGKILINFKREVTSGELEIGHNDQKKFKTSG